MNGSIQTLCDDQRMQAILAASGEDPDAGIAAIDRTLAEFPRDPRLHFLKGSLLVGLKRFIGAHQAMSRAIEIAPDFDLARFQLGFFELTSGEADAARRTWLPLKALPEAHWMRLFVDGLEHLAEDRFEACIACLEAGIRANQENLPLNNDMQLIIGQCLTLIGESPANASEEEVSAASLLLGQGSASRKH